MAGKADQIRSWPAATTWMAEEWRSHEQGALPASRSAITAGIVTNEE